MEAKTRTFLPYGDSLRVLVSHSELSASNHKSLLKSKGIFLGDYDKNTTVPTLMKLILDPSEFQELVDMQSSKEDNEKYDIAGSLITTHLASKELEAINHILEVKKTGNIPNGIEIKKQAKIYR